MNINNGAIKCCILLLVSFMLFSEISAGKTIKQPQIHQSEPIPLYLDDSKSIDIRVKDALAKMTLEEKLNLSRAQSRFSSHGVPRLGIPGLWMTDGPHGIRFELGWDSWLSAGFTNDSCTAFPALTCLGATWDPKLAHLYGKTIGEEARYRKKDILLGPGINIIRTPLNGRNFEYISEDPYLTSKMAVPYIQGVQENGISACVKHFALNNQETDRLQINVNLSERALQEIYLPAFKAAVLEGQSWSIMGAYNKVRGEHASHNSYLLNTILKNNWKFEGCVISDWGGTHDTRQAVYNGLDIEMGTFTDGLTTSPAEAYELFYLGRNYLRMVRNGEVPDSIINDKASRVLKLIFRTSMNKNKPWGSFATPEHALAARTIAENGIVLLKNSKNLLPIDQKGYKKIAVIGENGVRMLTVGGGSSELKVKKEVSPLEGLINSFGADKVSYSTGYSSKINPESKVPTLNKDSLQREALALAKSADLVIFIGGLNKDEHQDCEAYDRISYNLPYGQDDLISSLTRMNKNVIVVLLSGNAVAMPWEKEVTAIVQGWYLGSEAGNALANVLSGKVNPSGKLPFSFPKRIEDNGAISLGVESYPGDGKNVYYKDDILVGYRWLDTKKIEPLFPFGHGLSYTQFQYEKAQINSKTIAENGKITFSIPVKNAGSRAGAEVIQLYIKDIKSTVLKPEKELKGFYKVMLLPNETKIVNLEVDRSALAYFDESTKSWLVEPGRYVALFGSSSRDIRQSIDFEVK